MSGRKMGSADLVVRNDYALRSRRTIDTLSFPMVNLESRGSTTWKTLLENLIEGILGGSNRRSFSSIGSRVVTFIPVPEFEYSSKSERPRALNKPMIVAIKVWDVSTGILLSGSSGNDEYQIGFCYPKDSGWHEIYPHWNWCAEDVRIDYSVKSSLRKRIIENDWTRFVKPAILEFAIKFITISLWSLKRITGCASTSVETNERY